ncbi:MAG: hypothetical protein WBM23_08350 [Desulfomonilia bacterium]
MKTVIIIIVCLIAFPAYGQIVKDKPIEQFTEIQKTKEPACKVLLTSAIAKQVADKKAFQLDVKDWNHYKSGGETYGGCLCLCIWR